MTKNQESIKNTSTNVNKTSKIDQSKVDKLKQINHDAAKKNWNQFSQKSNTWANIASSTSNSQTNDWNIVQKKMKKIDHKLDYKQKRLIVTLDQETEFVSYELRDKINEAFKNAAIDVKIATITKTISGKNIAINTVDRNNSDQLIEHRSIWEQFIKVKHVVKDEMWYQVIVHSINVEKYHEKMSDLKKEIETYNNIRLKNNSRWLSKDLENKTFSSIIINVESFEQAAAARRELNVDENRVIVISYNSIQSITQCIKCQKFKHNHIRCKNEAQCNLCAQNHQSNDYKCHICHANSTCIHTTIQCANCEKAHRADSDECEMFIVLTSNSKHKNINIS